MTDTGQVSAPTPDLRIVPVQALRPHEEHDSQRSQPLIERFRSETVMINPPVVAPMPGDEYVILDGANRFHVFSALGFPHILVQVVSYESGLIQLSNWQHVIASWKADQCIQALQEVPDVTLSTAEDTAAIANLLLRDGDLLSVCSPARSTPQRNAALRQIVGVYQRSARLHRTASTDPQEVWHAFPDATALMSFPPYAPADIMAAAQFNAYLPPGISRHIVQGRALRVNYPLDALCDSNTSLEQKNANLLKWTQNKLANREVRYYAEATYQFDE
ncbi:MAG: hypothetical protein ABI835_01385 [Chloroflexota bacterium]